MFMTTGQAAARSHSRDLLRALEVAARELGGVVAVRSSGVDEDGRERSFAGQHETVLEALTDLLDGRKLDYLWITATPSFRTPRTQPLSGVPIGRSKF